MVLLVIGLYPPFILRWYGMSFAKLLYGSAKAFDQLRAEVFMASAKVVSMLILLLLVGIR